MSPGVSFRASSNQWVATIKLPDKSKHRLGVYDSEVAAAHAYDE